MNFSRRSFLRASAAALAGAELFAAEAPKPRSLRKGFFLSSFPDKKLPVLEQFQMIKAAGFEDARFERTDGPVMVGATVEQAMDFQLALGPAGEIFREAGAEAERRRQEIEDALRTELSHHLKDGKVYMQSSSWAITARKPAA
jgi:hypothetical protein